MLIIYNLFIHDINCACATNLLKQQDRPSQQRKILQLDYLSPQLLNDAASFAERRTN